MPEDYWADQLRLALASPSEYAPLAAVLGLPDDAVGTTPILEEALEGSELKLRIALLDTLYRLRGDVSIAEELVAIMESPFTLGDAGEELYLLCRTALNRIRRDKDDVLSAPPPGPVEAAGSLAAELVQSPDSDDANALALIVHGSWADAASWWQPRGDFHTYLREQLGIDHLYSGTQPFGWSSRLHTGKPFDAAAQLNEWVQQFQPSKLDIYAHGYGANVAMLATHLGLEVQQLVMMSPAVDKASFALWENVEEAFNIQAAFDPVLAMAGSGRWFDLPHVRELEMVHSGHCASHQPAVWEQNRIPRFLGMQHATGR